MKAFPYPEPGKLPPDCSGYESNSDHRKETLPPSPVASNRLNHFRRRHQNVACGHVLLPVLCDHSDFVSGMDSCGRPK